MALVKNSGRQEVIAARLGLPYQGLTTAGTFEAINLPEGAIITSGYVFIGTLTGVTNMAVNVVDKDGTELLPDMAGTYAAGRVDLVPLGVKIPVPSFINITTTGDATDGDTQNYLYVEYVVAGRAAFSEG